MQRRYNGVWCLKAKIGVCTNELKSQMVVVERRGSNLGLTLGAR